VWKWLGFNQKVKSKFLLENNFQINTDYKKMLFQAAKQDDINVSCRNTTICCSCRTRGFEPHRMQIIIIYSVISINNKIFNYFSYFLLLECLYFLCLIVLFNFKFLCLFCFFTFRRVFLFFLFQILKTH
jgi:hypothetical protein